MPLKLLFLGMIAAGCVPLVEKSRKQEEEKRRKEKLQSEYPELVSKLTILLGAGMTLFSAWNKIATNYSNKRKNNTIPIHPLYEEMLITCHEIESGVGEARAYERFGRAMWIASLPEILQFACPESSKRNEGTGAAIRTGSFQMPLKNAKIWQRKAGRRQGQKCCFQ